MPIDGSLPVRSSGFGMTLSSVATGEQKENWDRWYAECWAGDLEKNKEAHCLFMDDMRGRNFRRDLWDSRVMPEFRKRAQL